MSKTTRLDEDAWAIAIEIARQSGLSSGRAAIEAVLRLHGAMPLKTGGQPPPVLQVSNTAPLLAQKADNGQCEALAALDDVLSF